MYCLYLIALFNHVTYYTQLQFGITDNNEKYYICNICSNNNDESIEVVVSVSAIRIGAFIANIYRLLEYWLICLSVHL